MADDLDIDGKKQAMHPALFSLNKDGQLSPVRDKSHYYVLFRIARQNYALPLFQVVRVLRMVAIVPVPDMPDGLSGVISLAGRTIAVFDLRRLLGRQSKEPELQDRLLVVRLKEQTVAFAVDEVLSVRGFTGAQIEPPQPALSHSHALTAIIRQDSGLVMVLDAHRLLPEKMAEGGNWKST